VTVPTVRILVRNNVLARALSSVAHEIGLRQVTNGDHAGALLTDDFRGGLGTTVLVVDPNPVACRAAMDAVLAGRADGIISSDDPESLPDVLNALDARLTAMPAAVVRQAQNMPELSTRQGRILAAVMAGESNRAISQGLHLSAATIKREIGGMLEQFGTENRIGLVAAGHALGVQPAHAR
jgi:DNA-binding CsgD family transcriptional regulator